MEKSKYDSGELRTPTWSKRDIKIGLILEFSSPSCPQQAYQPESQPFAIILEQRRHLNYPTSELTTTYFPQ